MESERFKIIFKKLSCKSDNSDIDEQLVSEVKVICQESEEIEELRKISLDISDQDPITYSST